MLEQEDAFKSIYYDQRGCSYFILFFQAKPFLEKKALTELLTESQISLDAENYLCVRVDQRFGLLLPHPFLRSGVIRTLFYSGWRGAKEASKALSYPANTSIEKKIRLGKDDRKTG